MKKHRKTKRIIISISLVLLGLVLLYFGGSVAATYFINDALFKQKEPGVDIMLLDPYYQMQKTQKDYPLLQDREEVTFKHGDLNLQGYLYECVNPKGLILSCHGAASFADSDHAQYQNYFLEQGWDVFAFDMVGCGRSEGDGMGGLFESRFCVESAIKYIKSTPKIKDLPLCLIGHSWGAYGAVTASEIDEKIYAIAAISGFDAPNEMMVGTARTMFWDGLIIGKPGLDFSLQILHGSKAFLKASSLIKKHSEISYYLVHGEKDDVVPFNNYSITSQISNDNLPNATIKNFATLKHQGLWRSEAALSYYDEKKSEFDEIYQQYGTDIPEDIYSNFIGSVDKEKCSELNLTILGEINNLFLQSIEND